MARTKVADLQSELAWFRERIRALEAQLALAKQDQEKLKNSNDYRILVLKEQLMRSTAQMTDTLARMIGGPGF